MMGNGELCYFEVSFDGFPTRNNIGNELGALGDCEAEHIVIRQLGKNMDNIVEI